MKKIIVVHTQFNSNEVYGNDINNIDFKITEENVLNEHKLPETKFIGFGEDKGLALLYFDNSSNNLKVIFEVGSVSLDTIPEEFILLVSDKFYNENKNLIETILKDLLKIDCQIYPIYHKRDTYDSFITFFQENFKEKIKLESVFKYSHFKTEKYYWKDNPFYVLVELVNSVNKDSYTEALLNLKTFFDSEEETKQKKELNKRLNLLYKILGQSYKIRKEDVAALSEISNYNSEDHKADITSMRELRDILLKDII
jgi:hypothetical protein